MLHNCNFSAAKRFVNRYLFERAITMPFSLSKALQRTRIIRIETAPTEAIERRETQMGTRGHLSTEAQLEYLKIPTSPSENAQRTSGIVHP